MVSRVKYKYQTLADRLLQRIRQGEFADGKLPREEELMRHYKVGKITAYNAVRELVKNGSVLRVKGKGTFVNDGSYVPGANGTIARQVAVIMQNRGHCYGELHDAVTVSLLKRGLYPVGISIDGYNVDRISRSNIDILMKAGIKAAIVSGAAYWKNRFLDDFDHLTRVFLNYFDADGQPPGGKAVLVDYERGFYDAAVHLLKHGRRKVVMLRRPNTVTIRMTRSHKANHPRFQAEKGYRQAMKEFGLAKSCTVREAPPERRGFDLYMEKLLCKERPDALICSSDIEAVRIMLKALLMGIKIPDDLALIGTYDTPWCQESPIPLSSISIKPTSITEKAVESLLEPKVQKIEIIIPELIIRKSCDA